MRVRRQGGPGVDLTGNVAVKVTIALPGDDKIVIYQVGDLFGDDGKPAAVPTKLVVSRTNVNVGPKGALRAVVAMNYVMRHVTKGGGSLASGSQDVEEHSQATRQTTATLASLKDAYPQTFELFLNGGGSPLAVRVRGLVADSLCFASYDEAQTKQRFIALASMQGKLGDSDVGWDSIGSLTPLLPNDFTRLQVSQIARHLRLNEVIFQIVVRCYFV